MPTLTRFLMILFIFCAVLFGVMITLVVYVEPITVDTHIDVPLDLSDLSLSVNR
ncbi:hypothetical protein [Bartonella sp. CB169]|uniref:hypothetical protein n=1 Tax=Bartonella sp. CB169 TaxID=3112257 RepID=UPI00300E047D